MGLPAHLDKDQLAEAALGILYLTLHGTETSPRVWKGLDWDLLALLHERGWITDPRSKAKSVMLTPEEYARASDFLDSYFARPLIAPSENIDILAQRVLDRRGEFDRALGDPHDAASAALGALWEAVLAYTKALGDADVIHRALAAEFSGFREYLETTVRDVPGEFLSRAERMECLLFRRHDPHFDGDEPPDL